MLLKRHRFVSFSYPGVNPVENDDIVQCFLKPNIWNMSLLSLWDMVFWTKTGNDPTRQAFKAISWDKCWHLMTGRKSFCNKINSWYLWKINAVNNKTHKHVLYSSNICYLVNLLELETVIVLLNLKYTRNLGIFHFINLKKWRKLVHFHFTINWKWS